MVMVGFLVGVQYANCEMAISGSLGRILAAVMSYLILTPQMPHPKTILCLCVCVCVCVRARACVYLCVQVKCLP